MRHLSVLAIIGLSGLLYAQEQSLVLGVSTIRLGMTEEEVLKSLGGVEAKRSLATMTVIETAYGGEVLVWNEGQDRVLGVAKMGTVRMTGGIVTAVSKDWGSWVSTERSPENKAAGDFARVLFDMVSGATGDKPTNVVVRTRRKPGPDEKRECLEICRGNHCHGFCIKSSQPATLIQFQQAFLYEEITR